MQLKIKDKNSGDFLDLRLRSFQPSQDLESLARSICAVPEQLETVRKTLLKGWRRFPWGFYMVESGDGKFAATVQVGFFKPWWLVMALGRQPFAMPRPVCQILVGLGVLRCFELSNIYVAEDFRGTGLAQRLMEFAEELAAGQWRQKSILLLVRQENIPALKLYRKLGYETEATYCRGGIEKLLLVKKLRT